MKKFKNLDEEDLALFLHRTPHTVVRRFYEGEYTTTYGTYNRNKTLKIKRKEVFIYEGRKGPQFTEELQFPHSLLLTNKYTKLRWAWGSCWSSHKCRYKQFRKLAAALIYDVTLDSKVAEIMSPLFGEEIIAELVGKDWILESSDISLFLLRKAKKGRKLWLQMQREEREVQRAEEKKKRERLLEVRRLARKRRMAARKRAIATQEYWAKWRKLRSPSCDHDKKCNLVVRRRHKSI